MNFLKYLTAMSNSKIKIRFEYFENIVEILPTIYYYKQSFRERFGNGVIVIGWLKWGIVIYKNNEKVIVTGSTAIILFTYFSNLSLLNQLDPPNTIEIYSKTMKKNNNTLKNSVMNIKLYTKKVKYGVFGSKKDPILRIQHPSTLLFTKNKKELSVLNQLKMQYPESFDPKNVMNNDI